MLQVGQIIDGKYSVTRLIGEGGMGMVYEAIHLNIGRRVAVKVLQTGLLHFESDALARFQREALAAGRIETENIVQLFDAGFDVPLGLPYLVMEYLEGRDVATLLQTVGPLAPDLVARITAQTLVGLSKAHTSGVIHRDIKTANIFLATRETGAIQVKLLDFGIAKVRADTTGFDPMEATRSGALIGSVEYLSPEQAMGAADIDHRADLWSLGVVMYEALTGRTPHADQKALPRILMAICSTPPRPVRQLAPWVPQLLADILERALQIDARQRFASARAMLDAVNRLLPNGHEISAGMLEPYSPMVPDKSTSGREESSPQAIVQRARQNLSQQQPVVRTAGETAKPTATELVFRHLVDIYQFLQRWDALADIYVSRLKRCSAQSERVRLARELARLYVDKLGDADRALAQFLGILTRDPQDAETGAELARLAGEGRTEQAIRNLQESLEAERDPVRSAYLCLRLADMHAAAGAPQTSDEHVLRAMRLGASDARVLRQAANVYVTINILDSAKRALRRSLEVASAPRERAESYHALGAFLEKHESNETEAREFYTRARVEDPSFVPASQALARFS